MSKTKRYRVVPYKTLKVSASRLTVEDILILHNNGTWIAETDQGWQIPCEYEPVGFLQYCEGAGFSEGVMTFLTLAVQEGCKYLDITRAPNVKEGYQEHRE